MEKNGLICFILLWIVSVCNAALSCDMQIPHGDVTWWCVTPPCPYYCHEGYKEHDAVSWLDCSTSRQWVSWLWNRPVSAKDLCIPKPCPTVISKGAFSGACPAVVGSTCSFSCEAGYMRNTFVSELTCQNSTEWSADLTSLCLRPDGQQCPYYIPRGYLNLTCIREPGETCNFTCDEGYHPSISNSTIACGSNLEWNHNPASLCQETICPKYFEGGYVSEFCSRKYKATCYDYQCNPGYIKREFTHYVKCDESGQWIIPYGISPACVIEQTTSSYSGQWTGEHIVTIIGPCLPLLLVMTSIIIVCIVWKAKRPSVRKSLSVLGRASRTCLRPRENRDQNVTTLRQQPNADGFNSASSIESPSSNGIYVHSLEQRIPSISSSCKYYEPPPSYTETQIAANEAPPTYTEAVMDPTSFNSYYFNLYI